MINEIHYDESDKTERAEFVELYNPSDDAVDLSGYYFSNGIDFTFPGGTTLDAKGYAVIAEDPATMLSKFGVAGALGPFANATSLKNSGESVTLRDPAGTKIDEVDYKLGFPWPTVGEEIGSPLASPSIELINPLLDNDLGGSWRAAGFPVASSVGDGGGPVTLLDAAQPGWLYRVGSSYPAQDGAGRDWWDNGYDDSVDGAWLVGTTVIGFGDGDDATTVDGMRGNHTSLFLRKEFSIEPGGVPDSLTLSCYYDDGAAVYLNGVEVGRFSLDTGPIPFPPPTGFATSHEADWSSLVVNGTANFLVEGVNTIAIQCINQSAGSSDLSIDATLVTNPAGTGGGSNEPSPGTANSAFATSAPPQIRQVDHSPKAPASGVPVVITAKITDPDGVGAVTLDYQIVEPGDYFCRYLKFNSNGSANEDPRYEDPANWTTLAMVDDGSGGDALAADSIYSVTLPASLQTNRRLIRYRITAEDSPGTAIIVPYPDDPQPNFAYFVYDGTPDWSGAIRSGDTPVNYPGSLMSSIATYFLLSKNSWIDDSQFGGYGGSEYLWPGTMVYDGEVYDHIQYRPRGGVHRYQYGKNFWKFDFSRGHRFEARDRYGKRYSTEWDKLNFSSIVQQVNFNHRGEQGLFEGVGFKLFELCGVESCRTHYAQFYVVDDASPTGANQYQSDYYGLFLAIEQMDGRYLDEHDLPDGNLYKIEGHSGSSNNQGPTQVSDRSDVNAFISGYRNQNPSAQWWEQNLDIEKYLSYRTVVEGIHHYDIANGKNYFYYHNPVTDLFEVHPWDLDLTWANNMFGSGNHDFKTKVAQNPAFNTDYQNRVREIMDLLYNTDEGYTLIDEMVRDVWTPGEPSLVGADRRLWDNHPDLNHPDRYYDVAGDRDFSGMIKVCKDYIVSRGNWMRSNLLSQENSIPATPAITFSGTPGFPSNDLVFSSSDYDSGTGFEAMEWRISEVYNPAVSNYVDGEPYIYEIEGATESGELTSFGSEFRFPALAARPGQTYRARVRHKDTAGRWSHWSPPLEFLASAPDVTQYVEALRITELHYHPGDTTAGEIANGWEEADFEFIELQNIGPVAVDLTDVRFTKGIDFDFPADLLIGPGAYLLVVRNQAAFESRYGAGLPIAGEWSPGDKLDNGGENVKLSLGSGTTIIEFVYDDSAPWPTEPDGDGFSLTLNTPAQSTPADHADPLAWSASRLIGGTPGAGDQITFDDWASANGLPADVSPSDDPENDGLNHLLEYALGSDPLAESSRDLPEASQQSLVVDGSSDTYLTLSFRRQVGATDLTYVVEASNDLAQWQSDTAVLVSSSSNGDGTNTETWRAPVPTGSVPEQFLRLKVEGQFGG
ncbi:MAG: lamin tail domain-containing protein [Verrucomicrobiales bacterium]